MKTSMFVRLLLLAGGIAWASEAAAQPTSAPARGGYWNTETNLTTRDYTIVRFYNDQNQLVYEERLATMCLDLSASRPACRRLKRQLDLALQQVLSQPSLATQHPALLAQQLSTSRRLQRVYGTAPAQRALAATR
jgi:hypothetical protein